MKLLRYPRQDTERVHSSHWGSFLASEEGGNLAVRPSPFDPNPSDLLQNIPDAANHHARIAQPMIRRRWLERGPGPDEMRGRDEYVAVSWDEALDAAATELARVRLQHGSAGIFGGSYGWSSAGRFHHAQSQIHRFLNCLGGYTYSVNSYSAGAAHVILPRVFASVAAVRTAVTWPAIADHTDLIVAFGGMAVRNTAVGSGGIGRHVIEQSLRTARARGGRFVLVSPLRDDFPESLDPTWINIRPATDVALMLAIAHTLSTEGLHDRAFVDRCCVGYEELERYVLGISDACPKTPEWAATITGIEANDIRNLARRMVAGKTLIAISHSLQRAQYGEQPVWMALVLAAMIGQIGIQGAGFAYSLGAPANVGKQPPVATLPGLPQGRNEVRSYIPVARIADMLLMPGEEYDYNGSRLRYPAIRLVYWAGGNPFHHHQDLRRLRSAFSRPDTIVVHEPFWTTSALHADIVFPSTLTLERDDIGAASEDRYVTAMHRIAKPYAQAKDDYEIFSELGSRLAVREAFTERRTADDWIRVLYAGLARKLTDAGYAPPSFQEFWSAGELELPTRDGLAERLMEFREDPSRTPLDTPTGKIEITSETIRSFNYPDCHAHPVWIAPDEWLGSPLTDRYSLQLIANQPGPRLHSQLDFGRNSMRSKVDGREVMRIHPAAAAQRALQDGDLVKVFNDRGAFLAIARVSEDMHEGVVQVATGAWYDPVDIPGEVDGLCVNGNPNAVTRDIGTSRLAQGCIGQLCLVQVTKFDGEPPKGRGYGPPGIWKREEARIG